MKKCPFCAEEIQNEAIICRFCNRDVRAAQARSAPQTLGADFTPAVPASTRLSSPSGTPSVVGQTRSIGIALAVVGFLLTFVGFGGAVLGFILLWVGSAMFLPGVSVVRVLLGFFIAILLSAPAGTLKSTTNRVATTSNPVTPTADSALPAQSSKSRFEIVSIDSRVTEANDVWSKFAWKLVLRNGTTEPISCKATVEFLDSDDFVVDDDNAYNLAVPANQEETFTGYDLVTAAIVHKIKKTQAKVNCR